MFKIRASAAGLLMSNGRSKDSMGETCKNYLKEWLVSHLTHKTKEIESKYLTHGIETEEAAIQRIGNYYGVELKKNETHLENDYFTGTFDTIIDGKMVIDAKSSWDVFTFPYFMQEPPKNYMMQLQIYMALTGLKKASLCYCLENGTEHEIDRLAWKLARKEAKEKGEDFDTYEMRHWEEAENQLNYDNLPESMRIKVFEFEYDEKLIQSIKKRVIEAREYITNELMPFFNE